MFVQAAMGGNFEPEMVVAGSVRIHRGTSCRRMSNVSITVFSEPDLENILAPGERLLWSGRPCYGRRFIQTVGAERMLHIGLLVGIWVWSAATVLLAVISCNAACQRQYVLYNSAYFVSDRRAFVCRYGRNWRLGARAYLVSCPHSQAYPYEVMQVALIHPFRSALCFPKTWFNRPDLDWVILVSHSCGAE